jgi:carbon-monoxide dehydrogenase medium subunit
VIHTQSPSGKRAIPARDFFVDALTVDLQPGELITTIEIPSHAHHKSAYVKMPHPASRYALVGVCVVLAMDGDNCTGARVTVGGAVPKATLSHAADVELKGHTINETTLEAAAEALVNDVSDEVIGDIFAPEDYRKAMIGVYFKRAVHAALGK